MIILALSRALLKTVVITEENRLRQSMAILVNIGHLNIHLSIIFCLHCFQMKVWMKIIAEILLEMILSGVLLPTQVQDGNIVNLKAILTLRLKLQNVQIIMWRINTSHIISQRMKKEYWKGSDNINWMLKISKTTILQHEYLIIYLTVLSVLSFSSLYFTLC